MNKKVLFSATVDSHIMQFHLPYLKWFKEQGYEVHVATNGTQNIPYCDVKHVVPFERKPIKIKNLKAIRVLKRIIKKEKFSIIHCHTPMGGVVTRLAAKESRREGTRVIYTAHGFHFYKGAPILNWLVYYPVEKYLAKFTDTIITINKEDYEIASKKFSKKCKNIEYVPGVGIDLAKFNISLSNEEKVIFKRLIGLNEKDIVLTCVARLDKNKNQGFLIDVLEHLVNQNNNIHLLLIGQDEINGCYYKMVQTKKLDKNIHFLGQRDDISKFLAITDIILSASRREGLPVNVLEAFSCGIPVVALNCRGVRDLIDNELNGFIVNNKKEMMEKISLLLNNINTYNSVSNNNIIKSKEYDIEKVKSIMTKIYDKKKRVLHLLSSNSFSGAENVVCTIIKNCSNNYDMYYCSPDGKIREALQERGIKYIPLKKLSYFQVRKAVKNYKPDIIHAHDNKASVFASFFYKKCKIISHIHSNNTIMNSKNLKTILFNYCSKRIKRFICVSDSTFDNYYYKNNIKDKSVVLYNTIDAEEIINKANKYQTDKEYDLIFLGRLEHQKNPERLIEIVRLLKKEKDDISLAIVGDGIYRQKIEKQVIDYHLEENVKMYGFQKNPYPILKNSKLLIMTSFFEGTPMVALEAQALGIPIVATPVDGLLKIVKNDYNGFLTNDNNEIVDYIIKTIKNNTKLKTLSNNSKDAFNKNNDIVKYNKIILDVYES